MTLFLKLSQDLYQTLKYYTGQKARSVQIFFLNKCHVKNCITVSYLLSNNEPEKGHKIESDFCLLCTGSKALNS